MLMTFQASSHLEEYNEMLESILKWIEKAKVLVHGNIAWNSASQLREQYILHQVISEKKQFIWLIRPTQNFNDHSVKWLLVPPKKNVSGSKVVATKSNDLSLVPRSYLHGGSRVLTPKGCPLTPPCALDIHPPNVILKTVLKQTNNQLLFWFDHK